MVIPMDLDEMLHTNQVNVEVPPSSPNPKPYDEAARTEANAAARTESNEAARTEVNEAARTEANEAAETEEVENTNYRMKSLVWNHFKKKKIDGVDKAICNYCGKKLSGGSRNGTTHLREHSKKCMPKKNQDIRQSILNLHREKKDGPVSVDSHMFDQKVSRNELAKMIILHEYPLNMVQHVGFRNFVNSVNPLFKHVSRSTITSDVKDLFESEKRKLKQILKSNQGRVAVTTDMWTASNQKRGYMVVTAHYINESWNLCNKILRLLGVVRTSCPTGKKPE